MSESPGGLFELGRLLIEERRRRQRERLIAALEFEPLPRVDGRHREWQAIARASIEELGPFNTKVELAHQIQALLEAKGIRDRPTLARIQEYLSEPDAGLRKAELGQPASRTEARRRHRGTGKRRIAAALMGVSEHLLRKRRRRPLRTEQKLG